MRAGAGISGTAHAALIGLAVFAGDLLGETPATPVAIAEVTMMTGTEFEAATSAAPEFDPSRTAAPEAPEAAEERADVKIAEADAAPTTNADPPDPDAPEQGDQVTTPAEPVADASIAEIGDQPAAPLAPEDDVVVADSEPTDAIAPVAENLTTPTPAARPATAALDTSSPGAETEAETPPPPAQTAPSPEATPDKAPSEDAAPAPAQVAAATPEPSRAAAPTPETETEDPPTPVEEPAETLNDPTIPAPKLAPPPARKPRDLAAAELAKRLAREAAKPKETGATKQADAPKGGGTTKTVGRLSFRDKESLRVGIRGFFNPPRGLPNEDQLAVKLRIEVSVSGKITAGPKVLSPKGRLDSPHRALMRAGVRALKKSEAAGVFSRLPKDKHARWRVMNVIFTPREIRFL